VEIQEPSGAQRAESHPTYPFWGYKDMAIFLGAVIPAFLASQGLVLLLRQVSAPSRAVEALAGQFLLYGMLFYFLVALFRVRHGRDFWESMSWRASERGVAASLAWGPPLAIAVLAASAFLRTPNVENPIQKLLEGWFSILLVGVFATTAAPLCEELLFRGFIMPLLCRSLGAVPGMVITAAAFAVMHGPMYSWSWRHIALIGLAGLAFGWIRYRTGSTAAATAIHASYNLTFFLTFVIVEGGKIEW